MVLFDKGDKILKTLDFKKPPAELIYPAEKRRSRSPTAPTRRWHLGDVKDNSDVVAALGDAAQHDAFWGIRVEALRALGKIGGSDAEQAILPEVNDDKPWVREVAVQQLGNFKDDSSLPSKLSEIASSERCLSRARRRARRARRESKRRTRTTRFWPRVKTNSPDNVIRDAALEGLGRLGDDRAVPLLARMVGAGTGPAHAPGGHDGRVAPGQAEQGNHQGAGLLSPRALF